jgi:hypothetical protein
MDELTTQELRGTAFAANLRRAFGTPMGGEVPPDFAVLLERLSAVQIPGEPDRPRERIRQGM